jgi:hypothetical protein
LVGKVTRASLKIFFSRHCRIVHYSNGAAGLKVASQHFTAVLANQFSRWINAYEKPSQILCIPVSFGIDSGRGFPAAGTHASVPCTPGSSAFSNFPSINFQ